MTELDSPLTVRVTAWLNNNADTAWTPTEVATGIGLPISRTAQTLIRLSRKGRITRHRIKANGAGASRYQANPPSTGDTAA